VREIHFVRSHTERRSTSCAFPYHYTYTMSTRKERRSLQSYRRQWNPCHMDFDLLVPASHGPAGPDKLRDASATGTTGDTPLTGHSHYRTRRSMLSSTCLVGYTPLRLLLLLLLLLLQERRPTTARKPTPAGDRLRIESSHRSWTFKTTVIKTTGLPGLPTTDINHQLFNHRLLLVGKTNKWDRYTPHLTTNVCFHSHSCTPQYSGWFLIPLSMRSDLGNQTTTPVSMPVSWKYLYFEFSLCIHCFMQYTPNY